MVWIELSRAQIVGPGLGVIGLVAGLVCCTIPRWTVSPGAINNITSQSIHVGLWMTCVVRSTGGQRCKNYDSDDSDNSNDSNLLLPADMQAARAMIISCMVTCCLLFLPCAGFRFITCMGKEDVKPKINLVSGIGLLVAGLLLVIPASWSAHTVDQELSWMSWLTLWAGQLGRPVMELGACMFVCWAVGALLLLGGGLICYFSRASSGRAGGGTTMYYSNSGGGAL